MDHLIQRSEGQFDRRRRLHELLLSLIKHQNDLELMDPEAPRLDQGGNKSQVQDPARWLERNRRVLQHYQAMVKTAVTLDALLDSEQSETD